jgi:hypothetical protein
MRAARENGCVSHPGNTQPRRKEFTPSEPGRLGPGGSVTQRRRDGLRCAAPSRDQRHTHQTHRQRRTLGLIASPVPSIPPARPATKSRAQDEGDKTDLVLSCITG